MKKITALLLLVLIGYLVWLDQSFESSQEESLRLKASALASEQPPRKFTTDGCTLFPNSVFGHDFTEDCIRHDMKYWSGGGVKERKAADDELKKMLNNKIPYLGNTFFWGVRIFGHPLAPVPWRWGYGFEYPSLYKSR
ncbi:MAG: hypothetical protein U5L10_00540 [Candidatus Moranbacteria bacterium]|nr:hypothetical protein [Candidatus Moranbacteria bacterium]